MKVRMAAIALRRSPYWPRSLPALAAIVAAAIATGCGGGDRASVAAATRPDRALVRALPDPFEPAARQPPGTYVGRIGEAGRTFIGLVVRGDRALVYLCDGRASEWFGAPVRDGRLLVRSERGTVVDAHLDGGAVRGSVQPRAQAAGSFVARRPSRPGVGLFVGPDPALPRGVRRWIVLDDGVRGVSTTSAPLESDTTAGSGSGTRPSLTPPETTPSEPHQDAASTSGDGSSNTILLGEQPAGDGGTRSGPPPASTTGDGSSNTILLGEQPVNGVAADEEPRALPQAPAVTTCPKGSRCPPEPPSDEEPVRAAATGGEVFLAGGRLLPCKTLALLRLGLAAPARAGDAVARRQLAAFTAQLKANRC